MAGRKARHAASTRNTTCLASATQTSNPPKTTMRSRKKAVPCGSSTRFSSPASGVRGGPHHRGQAAPPHTTDHNSERPERDSKFPWSVTHNGCEGGHFEPAAMAERWRWDLNPRRGCPLTRFRGLRWAIHHRSRVYRTWAGSWFAFAGEQLRTGVNATETEPAGWRTGGGAAHPPGGAR